MTIMMVLTMNSVAFATGKLHSFFALLLNKLCIPEFCVLSTEEYAGYLRKCSIFKHLKTLQSLRSDFCWQFHTSHYLLCHIVSCSETIWLAFS